MKLAAVRALADLAKKPVPDIVNMAYGDVQLTFGKDYIIPKPVDPRLISTVAPAVAKAAMDSGMAQTEITDWPAYAAELDRRLGNDHMLSQVIETKARQSLKRVVFADAENPTVLKAVQVVIEEGVAKPILLGNHIKIAEIMEEYRISFEGVPIIDPVNADEEQDAKRTRYAALFHDLRKRKGITLQDADDLMRTSSYFGAMMVQEGHADAMIGGLSNKYPTTIRPALQIIGAREDVSKVASTHILMTKHGPLFLADTAINHDLSPEDVADITELVYQQARTFNVEPRIALVTYSNFGSVPDGESAVLMRKATKILHDRHPDWTVDGEMQVHMALDTEVLEDFYPFSKLAGGRANVLIFPNLSSANIAYNLLHKAADMEMIGPVLLGLKKPVHILQLGSSIRQIVDMVGIAAIHAQELD